MVKYKVVIEFETDKPLPFPVDAQLLSAMTVQLESLSDGSLEFSEHDATQFEAWCTSANIIEEGAVV